MQKNDDRIDIERLVILAIIWSPELRKYVLDKVSTDILTIWECRYLFGVVYKFEKKSKGINFISIQDYVRNDIGVSDERKQIILEMLAPWLMIDEAKEKMLNSVVVGVTPRLEDLVTNTVIDKFLSTSIQHRNDKEYEKIWPLMDDAKLEVGGFLHKKKRSIWEELESQDEEEEWKAGIPLGINGLNSDARKVYIDDELYYKGIGDGDLAVVQGDTGSGKSVMLNNIAIYQTLSGYDVDYYSMEIKSAYAKDRSASIVLDIPTFRIPILRAKKTLVTKLKKVLESYPDRGEIEFYDEIPYKLEVSDIVRNIIESRRRGRNVDCVIIDYLDLMKRPRRGEEYIVLEVLAREVVAAGKEYGFAVLTANQSNKPEAGKLSDKTKGRGGYGKVQAADIWMPLNVLPTKEVAGERMWNATIFSDKTRYGKRGTMIHLAINYDTGKFFDVFPRN